ncbi:DUF2829 domain-containing protein [Xenorhabdus bovienii]|uniref:Thoeris anti-defense Tad2 family protein n=1 Tax=Xenorhabdus bovienii TaxID=40576 RepID=UPI00237CDEEF|nr:MW1434 family type I TA system toxin [Xenorhabdus bovienii]MDE1494871.1 DUF2829 domain-containing protein [Xenorhabdus bovienii]MDE9473512.1 DUF2829 domain-containing protein [Xenorhabdus bovienii]
MSEVNKPENADTVPKCPFDPEQYKKKVDVEVDGVAPVGSLPWALIQVYLGKTINRSNWDTPNEYIQLTAKSDGGEPIHIEKHDKHGIPETWEPTPEDLMACDWELLPKVTPVECMLSFDLMIGTRQYNDGGGQDWGYLTRGGHLGTGESTFGTLTNLQSTIGIGNILTFYSEGTPAGAFSLIELQVDTQNQPDLGSKSLEVEVNGSTYNLGPAIGSTTDFNYSSGDAQKLGDLLEQNVRNTLHFCFNWK